MKSDISSLTRLSYCNLNKSPNAPSIAMWTSKNTPSGSAASLAEMSPSSAWYAWAFSATESSAVEPCELDFVFSGFFVSILVTFGTKVLVVFAAGLVFADLVVFAVGFAFPEVVVAFAAVVFFVLGFALVTFDAGALGVFAAGVFLAAASLERVATTIARWEG